MPAIHYSSYEAGPAVRIPLGPGLDPHVVGFMEQVEMVNVGVRAIIDRAIKERTSMVVEGVHMVPGHAGVAGGQERMSDALLLPLVVAVKDEELHRSHFLVREQETSGRRALARYLQGLRGDPQDPGLHPGAGGDGGHAGGGQREHRRHGGDGGGRAVRSHRDRLRGRPGERLRRRCICSAVRGGDRSGRPGAPPSGSAGATAWRASWRPAAAMAEALAAMPVEGPGGRQPGQRDAGRPVCRPGTSWAAARATGGCRRRPGTAPRSRLGLAVDRRWRPSTRWPRR